MPSTTRRLSPNGWPRRPSFEGSNGAIRCHCSSVKTLNRESDLTTPDCREPQLKYGRHALDAQTIALVVGVSGAIDFALFYASGQVMDRFGRLWAALPAMLLMGAGFVALALTHGLPQSAMWFALFAAVLGVGNGLSSGILLTLGADVAPQSDPAAFLGSWRTLTDAGGAAAPLVFSALVAAFSLSIATAAMGAIGFVGALAFLRWVPRFVPRER